MIDKGSLDGVEKGMPVVVRGNERIFPGSPVQTPDDGQEPPEEDKEEPATEVSG